MRALLSAEVSTRAAEGHVGASNRRFTGTRHIDEIEALCIELNTPVPYMDQTPSAKPFAGVREKWVATIYLDSWNRNLGQGELKIEERVEIPT